MKKIVLMLCMGTIVVSAWSDDAKSFEFFDEYLKLYDTQIYAGKIVSISGASILGLGSVVASVGVSMNGVAQSDVGTGLAITGYVCIGTGAIMALIGFPLWMRGLYKYNYILEQRDKYFWMTR